MPGVLNRLAGQPGAGDVDLGDAALQPGRGQPEPVRAEGVGLHNLGARADIRRMQVPDQGRARQVQFRQRAVQRYPGRVQHRAHRAIADHHLAGTKLLEHRPRLPCLHRLASWPEFSPGTATQTRQRRYDPQPSQGTIEVARCVNCPPVV
jgi:hypothetical protein